MVRATVVESLPVYNGDVITIECEEGYVLSQETRLVTQTTTCIADHVFYPDPVIPCQSK